MSVVVTKLCVSSTPSYLTFACAAVVSVVTAVSKAGTTNPAGCTNPRIPRDFADTPTVWHSIRAVNWVSVEEL